MAPHDALINDALALARRGWGWVSPNPMVGALVVKDGQVIGRGWHKEFGGPHAEVFALQEAGERARGATLYCTLEPCNHIGKTPPCAPAIIKAGITTVVLGALDPNPLAAGGAAALRAAGISVVTGVREEACRRLNAPFFKFTKTGLPLVSVKWAMSADGKIATASGDSKWITGEEARAFAHGLRARHDAVLVGIGTVLADAPRLTCRLAEQTSRPVKQPRRVILDALARTPLDAPPVAEPGGPLTIFCGNTAPRERIAALQERGAEVIPLDTAGESLPIADVLKALSQRGALSILVEGGSHVLGSFVDARLADMGYVFVAPRIIGGKGSITAVAGEGAQTVAQGAAMKSVLIQSFGQDALISGVFGEWESER